MSKRLLAGLALATTMTAPVFAGSEVVRVDVGELSLAGTLETPRRAPIATAVIIAGSGPTDRDGNSAIMPGDNNSLRYLAEALAKEGIATLRFDKRLIGESIDPDVTEPTLRFGQFVGDVAKLTDYLRERFDAPAFVIGHSEGGQIALATAARHPVDGVVVLAGPGRHPADIIEAQLAPNIPADIFERAVATLTALRAGRTVDDAPTELGMLFRPSVQPYLVSWFAHDPAEDAARVEAPMLLVYGTNDIQIELTDGERLAAAQPAAELVVIDGMNHVLKDVSGTPQEQMASYGDPDLPLADGLVDAVAGFIEKVAGAAR